MFHSQCIGRKKGRRRALPQDSVVPDPVLMTISGAWKRGDGQALSSFIHTLETSSEVGPLFPVTSSFSLKQPPPPPEREGEPPWGYMNYEQLTGCVGARRLVVTDYGNQCWEVQGCSVLEVSVIHSGNIFDNVLCLLVTVVLQNSLVHQTKFEWNGFFALSGVHRHFHTSRQEK